MNIINNEETLFDALDNIASGEFSFIAQAAKHHDIKVRTFQRRVVTIILSLISLIYFKNLIKDDEYDLASVASRHLTMNLITILTVILTMTCAHILNQYGHNMMKHQKKQ